MTQILIRSGPMISLGKSYSLKMKIIVFLKTHTIDGVTYVKDQPVAFREAVANALISGGIAIESLTITCFTDHCTNAATKGVLV
jgi:hypothetical protein